MTAASKVTFLMDLDNILPDNDRVAADPGAQSFVMSWSALMQCIAPKSAARADCRLQEPHR